MKFSRFLLGVAAGAAIGYLFSKQFQHTPVKPEYVLSEIKKKYKQNMKIVGSWIHVDPKVETINGLQYNIYQCGLSGSIDGEPAYFEFKVDADTGSILAVES